MYRKQKLCESHISIIGDLENLELSILLDVFQLATINSLSNAHLHGRLGLESILIVHEGEVELVDALLEPLPGDHISGVNLCNAMGGGIISLANSGSNIIEIK